MELFVALFIAIVFIREFLKTIFGKD